MVFRRPIEAVARMKHLTSKIIILMKKKKIIINETIFIVRLNEIVEIDTDTAQSVRRMRRHSLSKYEFVFIAENENLVYFSPEI